MSQKKNAQHKKHQQHHKQPAHAKHAPKKKVRGGWLTGAIVLVILHGLMMLGVVYGNEYLLSNSVPTWFVYSVIGVAIADIVAGVALWRWKGWGFYLYLVATIIIIGLGIMATGYGMLWSFSRLIPFVIVGYIMRPKWQYFD